MPNRSAGLSLETKGEEFILRRTNAAGKTTGITLSSEDVLTLARSAEGLRERIQTRRHPAAGNTERMVIATPVVEAGLAPEALGETILLAMVSQSGARSTFSLPAHIVTYLVERLPAFLARMRTTPPTRQ